MVKSSAVPADPIQARGGWALDVDELWSMAGRKPGDVDFVETYDDYPVIVMMQLEDLGFCKKGEGPDFVRSHSFTNDGTFPHNTSGGQLSVGQAGAAGGSLGLVEAMRQLTAQPLGTAVRPVVVFPEGRAGVVLAGQETVRQHGSREDGAAVLVGHGQQIARLGVPEPLGQFARR